MFLVPLAIALGPLSMSPSPQQTPAGAEVIRARYEVDLLGQSRAVFALPAGPRTIRRFRWVPDPDTHPDAWRSARLRLVWDGDDPNQAGVDLPLGRFVAPREEEGEEEESDPPALVNRRPMPYLRGGRMVIDAEGPIQGSFQVDAGPIGDAMQRRGYLRAGLVPEGEQPGGADSKPSAEIEEEGAGVAGPGVRYWYDQQPGPLPDAGGADR